MLEAERRAFIAACSELNDGINNLINASMNPSSKNRYLSEAARKDGNSMYVSNLHDDFVHEQTFRFYCQSIASAPNGSEELALAYGNRSAFLQHIARHKECIEDIDRSLAITASNVLKVKLLCRKSVCQGALGWLNSKSTLKEAKLWVNKIHDDEDKKGLLKLIAKTESSLGNAKQNKKHEQEAEVCKALPEKEEANIFDSVAIKHTEKYGRHLVAIRDFQPGEVIFTEKFYATVLNLKKAFTNCHNCLNFFWSGIPCDCCDWAMFCSEECKNEAMKNYHNVECSIITIVKALCKQCIDHYHISIRLLIMGLKEAGSIEQLKTELMSNDKSTSDSVSDTLQEEKTGINKFKNICNLQSDALDLMVKDERKLVVMVMVLLQKQTTIFGENSDCKELKDLLKNDNFLFIGSLLYKLFKIHSVNTYTLNHENKSCKYFHDTLKCLRSLCCVRGGGITQVASFINHSCIPNVRHCFTDNGRIVIFALQPIKKNSQIFDCYGSTFYQHDLSTRQEYLEKYNFKCDCQACMENWPVILDDSDDFEEQMNPYVKKIACSIYDNTKEVLYSLDKGEQNFDKETVDKLSNEVARATNLLVQPSTMTCLLLEGLMNVFSLVNGFKSQSYGRCQNYSRVPLLIKYK